MMVTQNADKSNLKTVVVLGAGVIGLTTALKIQEQGSYQVTIIAEVLPSDAKTIKYTSHWAGAHHVFNLRNDEKQYKLERDTFDVLWELSKSDSSAEGCFLRITQTDYYCADGVRPPLETMPDYKELPKDELPAGVAQGVTFSTVSMDTPRYLNYLMSLFIGSGGTVIRGAVQHIDQVLEGGPHIFSSGKYPTSTDAVIVCTGIGTRFLGGVEDRDVHPVRGQTVLVRAPWIRFGRTTIFENGEIAYIIPRRSGDVVLGGTRTKDDWYPVSRPETTRRILERTFSMCPELAPPEVRAQREPTVEDIVIIEEGCGLRPGRTGGIRLEVEWSEAGKGGKKVPIVFNYGHSGYGYQTSWGSAVVALTLLEDALASLPK